MHRPENLNMKGKSRREINQLISNVVSGEIFTDTTARKTNGWVSGSNWAQAFAGSWGERETEFRLMVLWESHERIGLTGRDR